MEDTTLEEKSIREIAGNEELIQQFLHLHRFYLCNQITQLGLFYAYMISKNVLRPEDQDDAESHPIRLVKIGKFLDIVATKGPNGFRAFLEVLEYEHSHVYLHITKEKPRDPPIGWRPSQPTSLASMRHKKKMADLISDMSQDAEEKKRKNEILQQYIMEAEEDHRKEREKLKKDLKEITSQKGRHQQHFKTGSATAVPYRKGVYENE
ncbi:hypothetical protein LSAT2_011758 [Lamellibrachia satsuma]|nr:hypothetical protein LSAT2_011758 [Lamellibrachia satsuma]